MQQDTPYLNMRSKTVPIKQIKLYESYSYDPYLNLAMEEKLMDSYEDDTLIFYLWQNKDTVVIGKNQAAEDECNLDLMREDNITLARRSSGGGAVYHDLGNLNFTFITGNDYFDERKQLEVVKKALSSFSLHSSFSGRNDLLIEGYKISGQAYLKRSNCSLHHGTLLIDVDINNLGKYLKQDDSKLKKHGVKSHRMRVKNIKEFDDSVSVDSMRDSLIKAASDVYDVPITKCELLKADEAKYSSKAWLYRLCVDGIRCKKRFDYGLIDINLSVLDGIIEDVVVNSDIMNTSLIDEIKRSVIKRKFNLDMVESITLSEKKIAEDVKMLLKQELPK